MATSSLLGIDSDNLPPLHSATGIDSLGPSDASDSGSDSAGAYSDEPDSDTDRFGTGERSSADLSEHSDGQDILPDHIEALGAGADDATTGDLDAEMDADAGAERPAPDQRVGAARSPASGVPRADGMPQEEDPEDLEGDDAPDDGAPKS
jgi:hypothetical protein